MSATDGPAKGHRIAKIIRRTAPLIALLWMALAGLTNSSAPQLEKVAEAHNVALGRYLYEALKTVPKIRVVSAAPGPLASPLLTYALPGDVPSGALHARLHAKHRVEVKVVPANFMTPTARRGTESPLLIL